MRLFYLRGMRLFYLRWITEAFSWDVGRLLAQELQRVGFVFLLLFLLFSASLLLMPVQASAETSIITVTVADNQIATTFVLAASAKSASTSTGALKNNLRSSKSTKAALKKKAGSQLNKQFQVKNKRAKRKAFPAVGHGWQGNTDVAAHIQIKQKTLVRGDNNDAVTTFAWGYPQPAPEHRNTEVQANMACRDCCVPLAGNASGQKSLPRECAGVGGGARLNRAPEQHPPQLVSSEHWKQYGWDGQKRTYVKWDRPRAFGAIPDHLCSTGDKLCRAGGFEKAIGYHPHALSRDGQAIAGGGYLCSNYRLNDDSQ